MITELYVEDGATVEAGTKLCRIAVSAGDAPAEKKETTPTSTPSPEQPPAAPEAASPPPAAPTPIPSTLPPIPPLPSTYEQLKMWKLRNLNKVRPIHDLSHHLFSI